MFGILALTVVCINVNAIIAASHHRYYIYEQDAYMHMVIALDYFKTYDWYQHFNYRINAPFGADTHAWTGVINALLVVGALLLNFFAFVIWA